MLEHPLCFNFQARNNQEKYEAMISGLRLAKEVRATHLLVKSKKTIRQKILCYSNIYNELCNWPRGSRNLKYHISSEKKMLESNYWLFSQHYRPPI